MLKFIKKCNNPDVLVVTPLLNGHKISKETKICIKRNDINFEWISYTDKFTTEVNYDLGLKAYEKIKKLPKYIIKVDNDISSSRNMLKYMKNTLDSAPDNIGYCYVDFEFQGAVNTSFKGIEFDPFKLMKSNYISSVSMIKTEVLKKVGGIITDEYFTRLLDWCLWLVMLKNGYHGIRSSKGSFIAYASENSISAGSKEDFQIKYLRVYEKFIKPMVKDLDYSVDGSI